MLLARSIGRAAIIFFTLSGPVPAIAEPSNGSVVDIRVGVFDNRPVVFLDADNDPAGLAIDVLEEIARHENWRLVYTHHTLPDLLDQLERGDLDLAVSIIPSAERTRRFDLTHESLIDSWAVVYKTRGASITGLLDLKDRRIATLRHGAHTAALTDLLSHFNVSYTPVYLETLDEVLSAVAAQRADAGVVNRLFGAVNGDRYEVDITGIVFNPVHTHYAAHKGAPAGLVAALDRHLKDLKADPQSLYYKSLNRWLVNHGDGPAPFWTSWTMAAFGLLLCAVLSRTWWLRRQVRHRTSELAQRSGQLEREVEQRRIIQERFDEMVFVDTLTGLPNRTSFQDRFPNVLNEADRLSTKVAVLFVDVDRLKTVNDSLGHATGDALIRVAADRLRSHLRTNDSIYRFGGDEFIITLSRIRTVADVETVATRLLMGLKEPIDTGGRMLYLSASMGIALYPDDDGTLEGLLRNADTAMYYAKERGRDRFQMYQRDLTDRVVERLDTQTRLHRALERNEFSLHYQPIIQLSTGTVVGVEALLRWNDPERGMIPPAMFIPHAEENGAIVPIGAWVLAQACTEAVTWQRRGFGRISVAVNVSSRQFQDKGLVTAVERALKSSGLDPSLLALEITEGLLLVATPHVGDTLRALKRLGITMAIDDFGTGYSSLAYLKQFPIDLLKIDRSFVSGIPEKADDTQIASTIIAMAHGLGLTVVAEGIETEQQRRFLLAGECNLGQGYHIAHPMDAGRLQTWLQAHRDAERGQRPMRVQERSA